MKNISPFFLPNFHGLKSEDLKAFATTYSQAFDRLEKSVKDWVILHDQFRSSAMILLGAVHIFLQIFKIFKK